MGNDAALISADWGTTSLRLYLLAGDGTILDKRSAPQGMASLAKHEFASVLRELCAIWLERHGPLPALLSGMVGSRQGWVEVPYVSCPAGLLDHADKCARLEVEGFRSVQIAAGMDTNDAIGIPDVMRGEECQIFGALALMGLTSATFVLPGTHSKWVSVSGGRIVSFRTFMTGEVFAALKGHTILGRMMGEGASVEVADQGFARGVETAARSSACGEWLHRLFSVRTLGLMGKLSDEESADYLSGLLIGWELASGVGAGAREVILVGSAELTARYRRAAGILGIASSDAPQDCVCAGHMAIATAAGLIGPL